MKSAARASTQRHSCILGYWKALFESLHLWESSTVILFGIRMTERRGIFLPLIQVGGVMREDGRDGRNDLGTLA